MVRTLDPSLAEVGSARLDACAGCCSVWVSYSAVVRAKLRQDLGETFAGVVRPSRGGLPWHGLWSLRERSIRWDRVRTCAVERDRRPGVPRHTIRLLVEHEDGLLEVILRGPWGAIALAKLRDRIRAATRQ
jgi:hypothetical protein